MSNIGQYGLFISDYSRRFSGVGNGDGEVFVLEEQDNCKPQYCTPRVKYLTNGPLPGNTFMLGFGEDARGNIWALANETGIPFKETGLVMKLVRQCADKDLVNGDPQPQSPPCRE
jgi:hypothetical protein